MRVGRSLLALVLVAALAGCGSSSNAGVAGVRQTLHQFAAALLSGNAAAACSFYSPATLNRLFAGKSRCERLLAAAVRTPAEKAKIRSEVKKIDSLPVSIHGNTATVSITGGTGGTTMVFENGRWLLGVSSPGQGSGTGTTG